MDNPAGANRAFTEKVLQAYSNIENPRLKFIVSILIKHLHPCVVEIKVTDEEWEFAWDFMRRMAANTCIESTSRFAMELGYHVTLVKDATAAYSKDRMQAAHELNGPTVAHAILTTAELLALLPATQEGEKHA